MDKQALLCVRYRYDKKRKIRLKTVEIVVEEKSAPSRHKNDDVVPVSVAYDEIDLREQLCKIRGKGDPQLKVWFVPYRLIKGTELESRIATE